jgi:hypothetical protein
MWPTSRAAIGMTMKLSKNLAKLKHKKYLETEMAYELHKENPSEKMFPTPTARDYKDSGKAVVNSTRKLLPQVIAKNNKEEWITKGSALNPEWVEWLMGYPIEWTELKD